MIKKLYNLPKLNPKFDFTVKENEPFTNCVADEATYQTVNDWINGLGLYIGHFSILAAPPGGGTPLHIDGKVPREHPKINWIYGNGNFRIFKVTDPTKSNPTLKTSELNLPYTYFDSHEGMELVTNFDGPGTILINASTPHDVVNITETRYCLSLTPIKRRGRWLSWEEATEIFT